MERNMVVQTREQGEEEAPPSGAGKTVRGTVALEAKERESEEVAAQRAVEELMEAFTAKLKRVTDTLIGRIDAMGNRIDNLERALAEATAAPSPPLGEGPPPASLPTKANQSKS